MAGAEHPERTLPKHELDSEGVGRGCSWIYEWRERGARHRPVTRVDWRGQQGGVGAKLIELGEPGDCVAGPQRGFGLDQTGFDPRRDLDAALASPDALTDHAQRKRGVEDSIRGGIRWSALGGNAWIVRGPVIQTVGAFARGVGNSIAPGARVERPDLVVDRNLRVLDVVVKRIRHRGHGGCRGRELPAVEQRAAPHHLRQPRHRITVSSADVGEGRIHIRQRLPEHGVVGNRMTGDDSAALYAGYRRAVTVVLPHQRLDVRDEGEHPTHIRYRIGPEFPQRRNRGISQHADTIEVAERSRVERVLGVPDSLIHRVALDEGVTRAVLVGQQAGEQKQRVRSLRARGCLVEAEHRAVVEAERPRGRVCAECVVENDVGIGYFQQILGAADQRDQRCHTQDPEGLFHTAAPLSVRSHG